MRGPHQERTRVGRDGRFELVEHVGSGGFGHVWRARDSVLAREVALKFLALDRLVGRRPNPERLAIVRDRFARESLIAAKVDSAYVARIYDCDIDGVEPFLVMEYVDGRPLSDYLGNRPLPLARTCRWSGQIARGLAAAHDRSVVHRDIKPVNVLVREADSDVRIVDFGLSRFVDATETHSEAGTPLYMSPERCRAEPGDERSDLYSLGCVMYEMVTGWPPFGDEHAEAFALARAHEEQLPMRPGQAAGVPAPLDDLIMALLAKEPRQRPDNARVVVRAIAEVERLLGDTGPEPSPEEGPADGAHRAGTGFADRLSAAELNVRHLTTQHGRDHHLVITARMELADLTGRSGDTRGAADLYDRIGRDCDDWYGPGNSLALDAFEGMARWVVARGTTGSQRTS